MYGNLPGLDMCLGDNVSWHVLSVGSSQDLHGIYFSGNTFTSLGSRDDTIVVNPHISQTLLMTPDSTGKLWIFSISLQYAQTMKKQCLQYALSIVCTGKKEVIQIVFKHTFSLLHLIYRSVSISFSCTQKPSQPSPFLSSQVSGPKSTHTFLKQRRCSEAF